MMLAARLDTHDILRKYAQQPENSDRYLAFVMLRAIAGRTSRHRDEDSKNRPIRTSDDWFVGYDDRKKSAAKDDGDAEWPTINPTAMSDDELTALFDDMDAGFKAMNEALKDTEWVDMYATR